MNMVKKTKKPQDLTNYSLRGIERRLTDVEKRVAALERPSDAPAIEVTFASGEGGDDLGEDEPA